jgi:peptidoglycan/LPS O-acetylase OafA/YrhL
VVFASYFIMKLTGDDFPLYAITDQNVGVHLLFQRGTSVLWTIPVEVQFYAVFPVIWLLYRLLGSSVGYWLAAAAALALALQWTSPAVLNYISYFLAGILVAMLPRPGAPRAMDLLFVVCFIGFFAGFPRIRGVDTQGLWADPVYLLLITTFLMAAVHAPLAARVLGARFPRFLGNISYSAYLLHIPVLKVLDEIDMLRADVHTYFVVFLIVTTAVSWLSYRLIEKPARELINGQWPRDDATNTPTGASGGGDGEGSPHLLPPGRIGARP